MPPPDVHFAWDDENEGEGGHARGHGLTPEIAEDVRDWGTPKFHPNTSRTARPGSVLMLGYDTRGRFWTIVLEPTPWARTWRVVTGYPDNENHRAAYWQMRTRDSRAQVRRRRRNDGS